MRSLLFLAPALAAVIASTSAQAATPYGAQYGGQQPGPVWEDVPPVPLDVPGRAPAPSPAVAPPAGAWHDHGDRDEWRPGAPMVARAEGPGERGWRAPEDREGRANWGHRHEGRGWTMPSYWMSPAYAVSNWDFYGLGRPGAGQHWVRYYDDAVLVDERGIALATVDDLDWDRPTSDHAGEAGAVSGGYGYSYGYGAHYGGPAYGAPALPMQVSPPPVAYAAPLVTTYAGPGYSTTTIVQAAPVVTTTTTTTYVEEDVAPRRIVRVAPRRVVHRRPRRITCCCLCR